MQGIRSPYYKTIKEIHERYADGPLLVLTEQTDIPSKYDKLWDYRGSFYFVVYYRYHDGIFECFYDDESPSFISLVDSSIFDVNRYNNMVHSILPDYWVHPMPEEDKHRLLHALQNIYNNGSLTKASIK